MITGGTGSFGRKVLKRFFVNQVLVKFEFSAEMKKKQERNENTNIIPIDLSFTLETLEITIVLIKQ